MKLLYCLRCGDVVHLGVNGEWRSCSCGASQGRYLDDTNAEVRGRAVPLGISNPSLKEAREAARSGTRFPRFEAWVITQPCKTVRWVR